MFKRLAFNLIILTFALRLQAQTTLADTGKVSIIQDPRINELIKKEIEINKKKEGKFPGYRVQVHFGSNRDKAKEVKSQFLSKYSEVSAYEEYEQPDFKIRVGNFRTKLDAYKFLKDISLDFPASFIVQDDIEMK